jgi:hypothetical protein
MGTGTALDGVRAVDVVTSSTEFTTSIIGGTSASSGKGTATGLGAIAEGGLAVGYLDIPESIPAKLVSKLSVTGITTGASPTVTFSGTHYLQVGQLVRLSGTTSTPSLDGTWAVSSIPSGTTVKLVGVPTVTGAQVGTAGTGQFIITVIDQPQKLEVAGLYEVFVYLIDILYTSGEAP